MAINETTIDETTEQRPARPDVLRPDVLRPMAGRPSTVRPDRMRPLPARLDPVRPSTARPAAARPSPTRQGTVRPGDLIFGQRPNWLQVSIRLLRHPWMHVGVVAVVDGEDVVVEFGPTGCGTRPLDRFIDAYDEVAVGRFSLCDRCEDALTAWMVDRVGSGSRRPVQKLRYGNAHLLGSGLVTTARRLWPERPQRAERLCRWLARLPLSLDGSIVTCATFVAVGLDALDNCCRPDLGGLPAAAGETGGSRPFQLLSITPTDIWSSPSLARSVVKSRRLHSDGGTRSIRSVPIAS